MYKQFLFDEGVSVPNSNFGNPSIITLLNKTYLEQGRDKTL